MAYLLKDLSLKKLVTQASHGFVAGDVLYDNDGTYVKAKADAIGTSYVAGVVEVAATNTFMLVSGGPITLTGLTPVVQYYLSATTAGAITTTKPSGAGQFVVPILVTGTSTDAQVFIGAPTDAAFGDLLVTSLTATQGTITSAATNISGTVTWNNAGVTFTGWKLAVTNTASATESRLIDLTVGGTSQFSVRKDGAITTGTERGAGLNGAYLQHNSTDTNTQLHIISLVHATTATPATLFGGILRFRFTTTDTTVQTAAALIALWTDPTTATRTSSLQVQTLSSGVGGSCGTFTQGQLRFRAGTTALPSISYEDNVDCGLYFPTVNSIGLSINAVLLATWDATSYTLLGPQLLLTRGTITTNTPSISGTVTWNSAGVTFTDILVNVTNTASNANSKFMEFQISTTARASFFATGQITTALGTITSNTNGSNYTGTVTWNNSGVTFTGISLAVTNTASAAASLLMNLTVGGNSMFATDVTGNARVGISSAAPASATQTFWISGSAAPTADPSAGVVQWSGSSEWMYRTAASNEGAGQTNRVHNRSAQVTGSGTNYTLTNTTARIDFGTTDAEVSLPTAGTYLVLACVSFIGDAAGAGDSLRAKLRNSTDSTDVGAEKLVTMSTNSGREIIMLDEVVTITASKTIQIFGHNATSARGTVESTTTTIKYVRLY